MKNTKFKPKRTLITLAALLLVIVLIISLSVPVLAANDIRYRMVLRYYDPIQITYNIKYPADGDNYEGAQDVPIGGVGVAGDGNYGISSFLSTQVYCADPFTPFHGRVGQGIVGGYSGVNGGTTADSVTGYVEAAPWNMSGAMQAKAAGVYWIATNGYRGTYTITGNIVTGADDAESRESVRRLNKLFYGTDAGPIDKEIALMATKVAIWKVIAGENVKVMKTTLDGRPAKRAVFDTLVAKLVEKAEDILSASPKLPTSPDEIAVTSFNIKIVEGDDPKFHRDIDITYDYYGPLKVEAELQNARGGAPMPDLGKVFLQASGLDSDEVGFVSGLAPDLGDELDEEPLFGTEQLMQFTEGGIESGKWISDDFYMAVPEDRDPENGDQLLVRALSMAPDVPVLEGTPIAFIFTPEGSSVQDWDAIQAFVGGASGDANINLFAEAEWYTGETTLGELYLIKRVENAALETFGHEFTFSIYYNNSDDFSTAEPLDLSDYPVLGVPASSVNVNTITLKDGDLAYIKGLPMTVGGGGPDYEYFYWVQESNANPNYAVPKLVLSIGDADVTQVNGGVIGPFRLDEDLELAFVTATNTYEHETGSLMIKKALTGSPGDWGVDNDTVFTARVKDVTGNNYVLFDLLSDGTYRAVGNNNSPDPTNDFRELVRYTVNSPAVLTNLWAGRQFVIEETSGNHYTASYAGNPATFPNNGVEEVTVTNTYENGVGNLLINKRLTGWPGDWGVDDTTVFTARVKDVTGNNYVRFELQPDGKYKAIGNNNASTPSNDLRELVQFTASRSAELIDLWAGRVYKVEEVGGSAYTITYDGNNVAFPANGNMIVDVTNNFEHGTGSLIIYKTLTGSSEDWAVDEGTVFSARIKDLVGDYYLLFELQDNGSYAVVGNSPAASPPSEDPRELVKFTAGGSAQIVGLWAGRAYEVEEVEGDSYTASYEGNGVSFPANGNMIVDVNNDYEHGAGNLLIVKSLAGSPGDWDADSDTVYEARVKDTTDDNYVWFDLMPDGTYRANGNSASSDPSDEPRELVRFTASSGARMTNLWAGHEFTVQETGGAHYTASYEGNAVVFSTGGNSIVELVNDYEHGVGSLTVMKQLAGNYADADVDETNEFTVRIRNVTGGNYLLFKTLPEANGDYWCVGNDKEGLSEAYAGEYTTELTVSEGKPVVIVNLWINQVYEVVETAGSGYKTSYTGNRAVFRARQNNVVNVINTYGNPGRPNRPDGPDGGGTDYENPYTGDAGYMNLWLCLTGIALFGTGLTAAAGRDRKRRQRAE